jgi:hypothetical protein
VLGGEGSGGEGLDNGANGRVEGGKQLGPDFRLECTSAPSNFTGSKRTERKKDYFPKLSKSLRRDKQNKESVPSPISGLYSAGDLKSKPAMAILQLTRSQNRYGPWWRKTGRASGFISYPLSGSRIGAPDVSPFIITCQTPAL